MRKLKVLVFLGLVLAALVGAGVVVLRYGRGKVSPAVEIKPNLVQDEQLGGIYVYGARAGDRVVLFDSGSDDAAHPVDALLALLKASRSDVKDIFLTHGHFDHIAGALQFPDARTHLGAGDVPLATGKAGPDAVAARLFTAAMGAPPLPRITHPLTGKTTVEVGGGKSVTAYPVPGHTRGSFAFLYDDVLFPGDIMVLKQGRLETTPWLFDAHPDENKAAIKALKKQLEGVSLDRVCTPHGGCTPKGLGNNLLDEFVQRLGN